MASRTRAHKPSTRGWFRFLIGVVFATLVIVGCSFNLAGEATGLTGNDGSVPVPGPRAELFAVDPQLVTLDEASEGTATFTVRLTQAPSAPVTIPTTVSPQGRITVEPSTLTFTPENFQAAQTLTLKTTRNNELDPPDFVVEVGPATSNDALFNAADPADVKVAFKDATKEVVIVSPRTTPLGEDFSVTEKIDSTAKFFVSLAAQPTDAVTIVLNVAEDSQTNISIGTSDVVPDSGVDAGDPAFGTQVRIVFPADTPVGVSKPLIVRGFDDGKIADGNRLAFVKFEPVASGDKRFVGQVPRPLQLMAYDDDSPNYLVSKQTLVTTEQGKTDTFTVTLATQPIGDVTVPLESSLLTEGTVAPASLTFKAADWSIPQTVTVTGVQDAIEDPAHVYSVRLKSAIAPLDPLYAGLMPLNVAATNYDDEGIVTLGGQNPLQTNEDGTSTTFSVTLKYPIVGNVQLKVSSNVPSEATVSPATLLFNATNWNVPQNVSVVPGNDAIVDGPKGYTITVAVDTSAATAEPYRLSAGSSVNGSNGDNDSAAIVVNPTTLNVTEGGTQPFTISLTSEPISPVTITMSAAPTGALPLKPPAVTVSANSIVLNAGNWMAGVAVNATVVQDCWAQGNTTFGITTAVSTLDPVYALRTAADLTGSHTDNDIAGLNVPTSVTIKNGTTGSFPITFTSRPMADVTLPISIDSGPSKITLNTSSVVVSSTGNLCPNSMPVSIAGTATGAFGINVGSDTGTEPDYSGVSVPVVSGTVNP